MNEEKKCKCGGNCKCKKTLQTMANDMEAWLDNLETKKQPKACEINNPDCENCGS